MNNWVEVLDNAKAVRFGVQESEVVSYKKIVNRNYGSIWFEVELVDGRVLTANMPGH